MGKRANIRCETSVGKALRGSRREEEICKGPLSGREAAPRVGEEGRVRAGVPGSET